MGCPKHGFWLVCGAVASLAACGTTPGDPGTLTLDARVFSEPLHGAILGSEEADALASNRYQERAVINDPEVGSVIYAAGVEGTLAVAAAGYVTDGAIPTRLAQAGVTGGKGVGTRVTNGTATYDVEWELYHMRDVALIDGRAQYESGIGIYDQITLTADFSDGTLKGARGDFAVEGRINANDLGGKVTYKTIEGDLEGEIGARGVIGAFAGKSKDSVFTGGFVGEKNP